MEKVGDKPKASQRTDVYNYNLDHVYCSDNTNNRNQMTNLNLATTVSDVRTLRKENKQLQAMLLLHLDLIQEQSNQLITKDKQLLQLREENDRLRSKSERTAAIERQQKLSKPAKVLNTSGGSPTIDSYFTSDTRVPHRTPNESVLSNTKENVKTTRNIASAGCDGDKQGSNETRNGQILLQPKTMKADTIVAAKEQIKVNNITIQAKDRPNLISSTGSAMAGEKCYSIKYQKIPANANFISNDKGKLINKIILQRKRSSNGEKIFVRAKSVDVNIKRVDTDKWITVKSVKSDHQQGGGRTDISKANHIVGRDAQPTSLLLNNISAKKTTNTSFTMPHSPIVSSSLNSNNSSNSAIVSHSPAKCRKLSEIDAIPLNGYVPSPSPIDAPSIEAPAAVVLKTEVFEELDFSEYEFKESDSKQSNCVSVAITMANVFDRSTSGYPIKSPLSCVLSPADSPIPSSPRPLQCYNIPSPIVGSTLLYPNTKRLIARNAYLTTNKLYKTREWQLDEIEVETKQMITDEINEKEDDEENLELPKWRTWELSSNREAPAPREWEDLSDDTFSKRHARFLLDERKRKKWDVQRIREQRTIERLKRRHYKEEVPTKEDIEFFSFFPSVDQLKSIQISDDLPVSAFGELVPLLPVAEYVLPWHSAYGVPQNLLADTMALVTPYLVDLKQHSATINYNPDMILSNVSSIVFLPKQRTGARAKMPARIAANLIIPKRE